MDCIQSLNSVGLIFNIVGVFIVFVYGFPQPSFDNGVGMALEDATLLANGITVKKHNENIVAKKGLYKSRSSYGLLLILIGFILQLIAANI